MGNGFRRKTDSLPTCMNCGSVLYGGFCSLCGQKSADRLTFRGILQDIKQRWLGLEEPWLRTPIELSRRPGKMIRGYLRGRRKPYVGPLSYAFFTALLLVLAVGSFGWDLSAPNTPWGPSPLADVSFATFVFGSFSVFGVTWLVAWLQHLLYSQERYSLTETWVFDLYVFGHLALVQTVFAALGAYSGTVGLAALLGAVLLVLAFALASFYRRPLYAVVPAALILGTFYVAGVFTSAALFRRLFV